MYEILLCGLMFLPLHIYRANIYTKSIYVYIMSVFSYLLRVLYTGYMQIYKGTYIQGNVYKVYVNIHN
jgi:hypothetical protein